MTDGEQAKKCRDAHGFTNCPTVVVKCECDGCTGDLRFDGVGKTERLAFLMCSVCGCTYVVEAARVLAGLP